MKVDKKRTSRAAVLAVAAAAGPFGAEAVLSGAVISSEEPELSRSRWPASKAALRSASEISMRTCMRSSG